MTTLAGLAGGSGSNDGAGSAARFNFPAGVAIDESGNVYVADSNNHTIRKVTSAGIVTTVAGLAGSFGSNDATGSAARFSYPRGVSVDGAGNVFVADTNNSTIRKVTSGGVVTTLAGLAGTPGCDDGTGSERFNFPDGVAVDGAGNVYVADSEDHAIRASSSPLADVATIDDATGLAGVTRQLATSPSTATNWQWAVVRRPSGSSAQLSSASIANPTFTPDKEDLFVFRLTASSPSGTSVTLVSLAVSPNGDVNGDKLVTAADIFYLINYLFAAGAVPLGPGDVNGDGALTPADIFYLINYLFAGGPPPR